MSVEKLKNLLRQYHLRPNFTFGQNFLVDDEVLESIIAAADVKKDDVILEIGPGLGNLTEKLLRHAGFVLSIEKDPKFYPILRSLKKNHKDNFRFEIADALEFDFEQALSIKGKELNSTSQASHFPLPTLRYKVVANIPYYITGKILQLLLNVKIKPASVTVLTQKEVAQSVVAKAGELSVLAISVQIFGDPQIAQVVPAESFYPAPKVDSAILHIKLRPKPKFKIGDGKKFFRIVKACFSGKRKQIHNTLRNNLRLPKEEVEKILSELKINPAARPQELTIEQWAELADKIKI